MVNPSPDNNRDESRLRPGVELRWPASALWRPGEPAVRTIGLVDLKDAVAKGIEDFKAVPTHAFFLCVIYPIIGLILVGLLLGYEMLPLIYPLMTGFALIGPLASLGLFELSRRREKGLDASPWHALNVLQSPSSGAIVTIGVMLFAIFFAWLGVAQIMYAHIMPGPVPASLEEFIHQIFTTSAGRQLIIRGNVAGFAFAVVVLAIGVFSFPMLVDRNVGAATAVRTSVRGVLASPMTMALWGLFVAAALAVGTLPFFLGLAVVLPVLGHSTWHLYRKVVSADEVI